MAPSATAGVAAEAGRGPAGEAPSLAGTTRSAPGEAPSLAGTTRSVPGEAPSLAGTTGPAPGEAPRPPAHTAAEAAARTSYGRLLAWLASRTRDLAGAEDALAEAFRAALETWPSSGVPDRPDAWLLTTARRNLGRGARHAGVRNAAAPALRLLQDERQDQAGTIPGAIPDRRLALLFACAHPGIDPADRAALMLQTVLGLDAARIAGAFLVAPAAMGQRLVRAKARLRRRSLRFDIPEPADLPPRLAAVLDAIYAAYGSGWEDIAGADPRRRGLAEEAVFLARLLAGLLPGEPEARGLLALVLHCEARRAARRDAAGRFVPLSDQDPALWSPPLLAEAEAALAAAAALGRPGRYQLEAAIQSAHAARARLGRTPWAGVLALYEALLRIAPSAGARVGHAAATAEAPEPGGGPAAGLALLDAAPALDYQPWWALRAHLLRRLRQEDAAAAAYGTAIGLTEDAAVRAFLMGRRGGG